MEYKEYRNDRSANNWPTGQWDHEPDKVQFEDDATKLPCLIVRNYSGALCGYVGVPKGHRYYGVRYDDVDVDVHGGLTFADKCSPGAEEGHDICHLPSPGESDDVWWLGFDCAHYMDYCPRLPVAEGHYRDVYYVKQECQKLAAQLI